MNHFYENQDYFQDYDYSFDNSLDLCQYSTYLYDNFYNYNQHAYFQQPAQEAEVDNTKSKKKKSHSSKHHHKDKNSDKYLSNYFQSDYCQPVCIAIGDIEGNTQKLHSIINFIKSTDFNFVFIGDIFDDISDSSPKRKNGFKCIEMISEFFLPIRDECNLSFKDIRFEEKKFSEIPSRVKFIAGNSECDVLKDIIDTKEIKQNSSGKYTFGKGKYTKTFSEEQLSILYRYFKNCCGVITLNRNNSHNKKHQNNFSFVDSVFFRHSPEEFNHSHKIICQMPKQKRQNYDDNSNACLLIVGHVHYFGPLLSSSPDCQIFSIDTSSLQKSQNGLDNRVAMILYSPIAGFYVEPYYYY